MLNKDKSIYNESSIKILEGLEAVRKRPSMYIGSIDSKGLHHLVWEIFDNAIDEAISGYCDHIKIKLNKDKSITISDNGRGIPVGMHKIGISTPEVIFSKLHSGAKFGEKGGYKVSGGLHGVGSSVVNALCSEFNVEIYRDGGVYKIDFYKGGKLLKKLHKIKNTNLTGVSIRFLPDNLIFPNIEFSKATILERIKETAYLNPNLKITFINKNNKKYNFHYTKGLKEFILKISKKENDENKLNIPIILYNGEKNEIKLKIVLKYTNSYSENILSFANNIKTIDGGCHVSGFKKALTRAINDYSNQNKLNNKNNKFEGQDIREGLNAIISVLIPEKYISYEGQTKGKLSGLKVKKVVEQISYEKLFFWLQANKKHSKQIINKILISQQARIAAKKAKHLSRMSNQINTKEKIKLLSGKLTPAQSNEPSKCELFLVEGDSAGGSAKLGRNRNFQAILPLKGKIINAIKAKKIEILSNTEVKTIINAIGSGFDNDFNIKNSNYGKIIIMTDADTDGAHIQILLLSFFFKYMKELFDKKLIYIAMPPLFKLSWKKKYKYFWNNETMQNFIIKEELKKYNIQRYKGLGEMNASQLWETTMDPNQRVLIQVKINNKEIIKTLETLMGLKSENRKKWIEENINFSANELFIKGEK